MSSDDLAIFLFWLALAVPFGIEAVNPQTRAYRLGFGVLCAISVLASFLWKPVANAWPPLVGYMTELATSPVSWFVIIMFVLAGFAVNGRGWKRTNMQEAAPRFGSSAVITNVRP